MMIMVNWYSYLIIICIVTSVFRKWAWGVPLTILPVFIVRADEDVLFCCVIASTLLLVLEAVFKGENSVFMKYNPFNEKNRIPKGLCLVLLVLATLVSGIKLAMLIMNKW